METSQLRKFASHARQSLLEQVSTKLKQVLAEGSSARKETPKTVEQLEAKIRELGSEQTVEQVAYTWFNRFCALRYMDVNRYTKIGIVSPADGQFQPEILAEAKMGNIDETMVPAAVRDKVMRLLDRTDPSDDPEGESYRLLAVAVCNHYHSLMPFMFEKISDYTELLLPDDLLSGNSILAEMREALVPENCSPEHSDESVEVIGWLYQFYIAEKKDDVFAALKKGKKITPENIPAATQLFTPHWIVRYLVENSLGRLWMLNHPESKLIEQMDYYIKPEEPETDFLKIAKPEEIKICDPACGSGHMLTYAFDLLYAIYEEQGYQATDIPRLILTHNLYGIEIDQRAGALAAFALTMKAREKYRRFLTGGKVVQPNICVLENLTFDRQDFTAYLETSAAEPLSESLENTVRILFGGDQQESIRLPSLTEVLSHCDYIPHALSYADALFRNGQLFQQKLRHKIRRNKRLRKAVFKCLRKDQSFAECDDTTAINFFKSEFRCAAADGSLIRYSDEVNLAGIVHDFYFKFLNQWEEADNFGSLIRPMVTDVSEVLELLRERQMGEDLFLAGVHQKVLTALRQADYLSPKYHVVVANPPYMGGGGMNPSMKAFVRKHFKDASGDTANCFAMRNREAVSRGGYVGMITNHNWMFVSTFSSFRESLLSNSTFSSFLHNGRGVWGADWGTCAFVFCAERKPNRKSEFRRLFTKASLVQSNETLIEIFKQRDSRTVFFRSSADFESIPGEPIVYWLTDKQIATFSEHALTGEISEGKSGLSTGKKERFCREWYEVSHSNIGFGAESSSGFADLNPRWATVTCGGSYRKWYGNFEEIIDWANDGRAVREFKGSTIRNPNYYFREGITWSDVTNSTISFRYIPGGCVITDIGPMAFGTSQSVWFVLGLSNSRFVDIVTKALNPTIHFKTGDFARIPAAIPTKFDDETVKECVEIARRDWDSSELSWDFDLHRLLSRSGDLCHLQERYESHRRESNQVIERIRCLEKENNRAFLEAFRLSDELDCEVTLDHVTLTCNPIHRYGSDKSEEELEALLLADTMREFISYAVGCMLGRYSLDKPGLILANQGETVDDYLLKHYRTTREINPSEAILNPKTVVFGETYELSCMVCGGFVDFDEAVYGVERGIGLGGEGEQLLLGCCKDCVEIKDERKLRSLYRSYRLPKLKDFSVTNILRDDLVRKETLETFLEKAGCFAHAVPRDPEDLKFLPDDDNVIPLLDGDWFTDDISERFKEFLKVTFGTEYYEANLTFLENALYPDNLTGKKRKTIRDYFLKEFYSHHVKLYKKRPIYWLFSSPKGTFNALIYMHRYRPDTASTVLQYLRDFQEKLAHRRDHLQAVADSGSASQSEKTKALKEVTNLKKQLKELEDYETDTLFPLAQKRIEIDLDDGVKHNYPLFGKALKKITGLT